MLGYSFMDIARPDLARKKNLRRIVWIAIAVLLACTAFLVLRLKNPPRHRENVTLSHDGRAVQAFVVFPRAKKKASVIVLVHEIYGLSDWARTMADELSDEGFIVVEPDLLSGHGPNGSGGYNDYTSQDERVQAVSSLDPATVLADLDATVDFAKKLPDTDGKIAVVGFSWGGWKSFEFATRRKDLNAVFVFYGTGPDDVTGITAPVYGFYAGNDEGVDGTVTATKDAMAAAHKLYDPVTYDGADHGFMRIGEDAKGSADPNKIAHDQAFVRLVKLLKEMGTR